MKKLLLCLLLASCGANSNDKMNELLSEKKQTETRIDSLTKVSESEAALIHDKDTAVSNQHINASFKAELAAREEKKRLDAINYSIDSLGKMK